MASAFVGQELIHAEHRTLAHLLPQFGTLPLHKGQPDGTPYHIVQSSILVPPPVHNLMLGDPQLPQQIHQFLHEVVLEPTLIQIPKQSWWIELAPHAHIVLILELLRYILYNKILNLLLLLVSDQVDHVVADPLFTMGGQCELLEVQPALVPVLVVFEIFLDLLDDGPDIVDVVGEEDSHE